MSFAKSFRDVYNYRLLYASSVGFFPIKVNMVPGSTHGFEQMNWPPKASLVEESELMSSIVQCLRRRS